jgi:class 3 adenylate cyclase/alpha-beta hydrolase superfamily lysophospholipase
VDGDLDVRYAKTVDGLHIAYATLGDGPPDLLQVRGAPTHLRVNREEPLVRRYHERLASFSRLILMDERGTGMSDPLPLSQIPTPEEQMDDIRAVLDALDVAHAALLGDEDGGPLAMLFAATHPERVDHLVLYGTYAALTADVDYPIGVATDLVELVIAGAADTWGTLTELPEDFAPSDPSFRRRVVETVSSVASPGQAQALIRRSYLWNVRPFLGAIRVPTLVLHRGGDRVIPIAMGRYIADHIEGARFMELAGEDHVPIVGDVDSLIGEIEEFVTGERSSRDTDRILVTVLFTDIVSSTQRAAQLGDLRWRELLDDHDAMVQRQLERFRGRAVKHTGDGFMATFDGPARAIRCAAAIRGGGRQLGLEIRAGLHTGECDLRGDDLSGLAVHIAARVGSLAGPGEVLVSSAVPPLVIGSGIEFTEHGEHELKGVPDTWNVLAMKD